MFSFFEIPSFGNGVALTDTESSAGAIKLAHITGTRIDMQNLTLCSFQYMGSNRLRPLRYK
jgi:hypothetical protein